MPIFVNQALKAIASAYDAISGHVNDTTYSRLPLTISRTSSSGVSYDSSKDAEQNSWWPKLSGGDLEDEETQWAEIWSEHKRKILALLGVIFAVLLAALGLVYRQRTALGPLILAALAKTCESIPWNERGWYQHPTVYSSNNHRLAHQRHLHLQPLEFQQRTSQACADLWISRGILCEDLQVEEGQESVIGDSEIDVAWTFVEPTSYWKLWKAAYANEAGEQQEEGTGATHFRSFDEIRYSIRSVVQNLPFVKKMTLLATSVPSLPPPPEGLNGSDAYSAQLGCRVAQTPDWLNLDKVKLSPIGNNDEVQSRLEILSHWEQFDSQSVDQEETLRWKHSVLPTFNSHSIESQLYNLPSPSETVLYMNNDNYIGRPLHSSDISTRILGPIFRIYPFSWSTGSASLEDAMAIDGEGNARVMPNTLRVIDDRFGRRDRNYPEHVAATLPSAMMDEVAQTWSEELKETAGVRFRGQGAEVWLPLLVMYHTIEKQREATLWSFVVAKSDVDASNAYSLPERQKMLADLSGQRDGDLLHFKTPKRTWNDVAHKEIIKNAGLTVPNETQLYWAATNGYPYVSGEEGNHVFPNYDGSDSNFCTISIGECFGRPGFFDDDDDKGEDRPSTLKPDELLRRVAFDKMKCGDCLIAALLSQSGERGFEAFLPEKKDHIKASRINTMQALVTVGGWEKRWQDTEFSTKKVVPKGWNRRDFAVRLIQRYTFSYGETPTAFNELNNDPGWIGWLLWRWSEDKAAFMALNDHVTTDNVTLQTGIQEQVQKFQEKMWPNATLYES